MRFSRRKALKSIGVVVTATTSGCNSFSLSQTDNQESETQTTASGLGKGGPKLSLTAEVMNQSTADTPAQIMTTITNIGSELIEVGFGPTLVFRGITTEDSQAQPGDLVLDPDTYVGPWDDPFQSDDGCWRFPEDGDQSVQMSLEYRQLSPSETYTEQYSIYTLGDVSECLPTGTYTFNETITRRSEPTSFELNLGIRILSGNQVQISRNSTNITSES